MSDRAVRPITLSALFGLALLGTGVERHIHLVTHHCPAADSCAPGGHACHDDHHDLDADNARGHDTSQSCRWCQHILSLGATADWPAPQGLAPAPQGDRVPITAVWRVGHEIAYTRVPRAPPVG